MARAISIDKIASGAIGQQGKVVKRQKRAGMLFGAATLGVGLANMFIRQKAAQRMEEFNEGVQGALNDASARFNAGINFWNRHNDLGGDEGWKTGLRKLEEDKIFGQHTGVTRANIENLEEFNRIIDYDMQDDYEEYENQMAAMEEFRGYGGGLGIASERTRYLAGIKAEFDKFGKEIEGRRNVGTALLEALGMRPSTKLSDVKIAGRTVRLPEGYAETPHGQRLGIYLNEQLARSGRFDAAKGRITYDESDLMGDSFWQFVKKEDRPEAKEFKYADDARIRAIIEAHSDQADAATFTDENEGIAITIDSDQVRGYIDEDGKTQIGRSLREALGEENMSLNHVIAMIEPVDSTGSGVGGVNDRGRFISDLRTLSNMKWQRYTDFRNMIAARDAELPEEQRLKALSKADIIQEALRDLQGTIRIGTQKTSSILGTDLGNQIFYQGITSARMKALADKGYEDFIDRASEIQAENSLDSLTRWSTEELKTYIADAVGLGQDAEATAAFQTRTNSNQRQILQGIYFHVRKTDEDAAKEIRSIINNYLAGLE